MRIRCLYEDSNQRIWICTNNDGLNKYNVATENFEQYKPDPNNLNSISHARVRSIIEAMSGALWVGTANGLNKLDPVTNIFTHHVQKDDVLANNIMAIYEESEQDLWLGTSNGLVNYNPQTEVFSIFDTTNRLSNNTVYTVIPDGDGYLWLSTNNGLSRFHIESRTFTNFHEEDGIQNNEFNSGASFRDQKTGKLYFGGINGVTSFFPDKVSTSNYLPPILITDFSIFNKTVPIQNNLINAESSSESIVLAKHISYTRNIELTHDQQVFSFEFSALDFSNPEKNQYAYMMEGFDKNWVYTDAKRRFATYTNLDHGNYIFKVKGTNNDGVWNEIATEINIKILRSWWESPFFITTSLLCVIIMIITAVQFRMRNIRQMNLHLESEVNKRTVDLKHAQKKLMEQAHQAGMAQIASSVLHNIGNVVNSVNISTEQLIRKFSHLKTKEIIKGLDMLLNQYLKAEEKEQKLPSYLSKLSENLDLEKQSIVTELKSLAHHSDHIKNIIHMQQSIATTGELTAEENIEDIIDEALKINSGRIHAHSVTIQKEYNRKSDFFGNKHKLLTIVTNLIKNAIDAQIDDAYDLRTIIISTRHFDSNTIEICSKDKGIGMSTATLKRVFEHGFTTKKDGHGFGLHSASLAAMQMGGTVLVFSEGLNKGSSFTLRLPIDRRNTQHRYNPNQSDAEVNSFRQKNK